MSHWRNVLHPGDEPDAEMRRIDEMRERLGELDEDVERVRALIRTMGDRPAALAIHKSNYRSVMCGMRRPTAYATMRETLTCSS